MAYLISLLLFYVSVIYSKISQRTPIIMHCFSQQEILYLVVLADLAKRDCNDAFHFQGLLLGLDIPWYY